MKKHTLFITVTGFLLLVAIAARANNDEPLAPSFLKPESVRFSLPALADEQLKNAGAVSAAAEKIWQAYKSGAIALGWDQDLPALPPSLEAIQAMPVDQRPQEALGAFVDSGKEMPFYLLAKGARGTNGWPLFISMHGGGMDPDATGPHGSAMNDSEWQAQVRLFGTIYPGGLYFLPRMADDHDGRWWYAYVQAIYDRAIRRAILFRDVDPNRVYVMGISEGGYAGYRLGAHMADHWAGSCAMAAAEPMDTSPPENFRNLPFRCGIGELDSLYNRINLARNYFAKLDELKQSDGAPAAYVHFFDEQKGNGHHINYQPGPLWIDDFVRNPWPTRVVWTVQPLNNVVRQQMYWLALDSVPQNMPLMLTARVEKNVVTITAEQNAGDHQRIAAADLRLRVYLNDTLANLDRPVKVVVNGKSVFDGIVKRTAATLARSLNERGDPFFMFPAEIPVKL